jgi:hypothetical protein
VAYGDHVAVCDAHDLADFVAFEAAGEGVGWIPRPLARRLAGFADVFEVAGGTVRLARGLADAKARTRALADVVAVLRAEGRVPLWRDEAYAVAAEPGGRLLFEIERGAAALFGVRARGVHVNGFVRGDDGGLSLWIARRSATASVAPGALDNMVAGGLPAGLTIPENLAKECAEEAAIPAELSALARPVGEIAYTMAREGGLRRDTLFCFDLALPAAFRPRNMDGEVAEFRLLPALEVAKIVEESDAFKFNCNLVIIHFLLRHGLIGPDHPEHPALSARLLGPPPPAAKESPP